MLVLPMTPCHRVAICAPCIPRSPLPMVAGMRGIPIILFSVFCRGWRSRARRNGSWARPSRHREPPTWQVAGSLSPSLDCASSSTSYLLHTCTITHPTSHHPRFLFRRRVAKLASASVNTLYFPPPVLHPQSSIHSSAQLMSRLTTDVRPPPGTPSINGLSASSVRIVVWVWFGLVWLGLAWLGLV
jgi:hypothetical protein